MATLAAVNISSTYDAVLRLPDEMIFNGTQVLVVDGNGSLRCALVGDNLAALAIKNNWAGLIVNGCVRDAAVMENMQIGARALNTHPKKSVKRNSGEVGVKVEVCFDLRLVSPVSAKTIEVTNHATPSLQGLCSTQETTSMSTLTAYWCRPASFILVL